MNHTSQYINEAGGDAGEGPLGPTVAAGGNRWIFALGGMVLLAAAVLGLESSAQAVAEEEADGFTSSFSSPRDPLAFAEDIAVPTPQPVVPMTRQDAVAEELMQRSRTLSSREVLQVAQAVIEEADLLGHDPFLFLALIRIESNYNHLAISPVGAEGLMQLMPPTAAWVAEREGVEWPEKHSFDPVLNVRLGSRYLAHLTRLFSGRIDHALTAYNRGPAATQYLVSKYGDLPREIRDFYATKVLDKYRELQAKYGHLPSS